MALDKDIFAPITVPADTDAMRDTFATLQTWLPRLRALDAQVFTALQGASGVQGAVAVIGPGGGGQSQNALGVTLTGTAISQTQASQINIQSFSPFTNFIGFGAYYTGNDWVATSTSAIVLYSTAGTFIVYKNTGLTPGKSFSPTVAFSLSGTEAVLSQGQLAFPVTQSPSSNANTLDDYEEGTWTPIDSSGASLTFTVSEGRYVKIGQLVVLEGVVTYPVTANGSTAKVGGLPFTQLASSTSGFGSASFGFNDTSLVLHGIIGGALTAMTLFTNAGVGVTNAQMSAKTIEFTISYRASA